MRQYLFRRLLIFIPTLLAITLVAFLISISATGDPVEEMLTGKEGQGLSFNQRATEREYLRVRRQLGLDKPVFYFSVTSMAEPDTLYKIPRKFDRRILKSLIYEYGNWPLIQEFYLAKLNFAHEINQIKDFTGPAGLAFQYYHELDATEKAYLIPGIVEKIFALIPALKECNPEWEVPILELSETMDRLQQQRLAWKIYIPKIHFFGLDNQYHNWLIRLFTLDLGNSMQDNRPVLAKFWDALPWTVLINVISLFISYLISIPLGIYSAINRNTSKDRLLSTLLFVLYSLPSFWVATLLIHFFCDADYFNIFPSNGIQSSAFSQDWSLFKKMSDWGYHLILPIFCYTYGSFAFLSRQMRVGMLEVVNQDYIRTARAKGLNERLVIMRHAFRNSLIPVVTLFGSILPGLIGGSIIIETIFTVPGMGNMMFTAQQTLDYPLLIAFFTLLGALTQIGILVSDLIYHYLDPRISFAKR